MGRKEDMGKLEAKLINHLVEDRDVTRHEAYQMAAVYIALIIGQQEIVK